MNFERHLELLEKKNLNELALESNLLTISRFQEHILPTNNFSKTNKLNKRNVVELIPLSVIIVCWNNPKSKPPATEKISFLSFLSCNMLEKMFSRTANHLLKCHQKTRGG